MSEKFLLFENSGNEFSHGLEGPPSTPLVQAAM
jgi:hypothetical protein